MSAISRRTVLIGFAFLSICAFWQLYDFVIPLILRDTFLVGDDVSGWIMALDNILALFLLPMFGRLSDRTHTRIGRRMPYIISGTGIAVIFMLVIPSLVARGAYIVESVYTGAADASMLGAPLFKLLIAFMILLALLLIAMGSYRSPAVALMPDITPKALRSKANAIINLMGAVGGIITLGCLSVFTQSRIVRVLPEYSQTGEFTFVDYTPLFVIVAAVMVISVAIVFFTVNENKHRITDISEEKSVAAQSRLPRAQLRSLIFMLVSVFFWFMGYNAVTTAYSRYFVSVWGDVSGAAACLTIAMAGAVVSYIPVGILSSRIGRKRMILIGVALLAICFAVTTFIRSFSPAIYLIFILVGFAWAAINVNSYPMVVEIGRVSDTGKYTGYYYTFSMAGQIITPIVSGFLLENVGYHCLFPYAAVMVAIAFITMLQVRHGDSIPAAANGMHQYFDNED